MSGYLDRLVYTVSHPRETVHPRAGSLFAPYRSAPDSPSEWFEQAETVATYPARSESSTIGEPAETVQHPTRSGDSQSPLLPGTANEPLRIFEAVQRADVSRPAGNTAQHDTLEHAVEPFRIFESLQRADGSPPAGNKAQHDTLEHAVQMPRRLVAPQAQRAVPDSRYDAGGQSYVPLIHPQRSEAHSAGPEALQFSTEARSMREASANLMAEGRSARAEREPDEIQIHIGRIEVTAVQPPAPRAPKPPDKAISLDAYLERRNGRAR
jgi:hypothetical protein